MKSLHRLKALECYNGSRLILNKSTVYPNFILLREAARSTFCYIAEDLTNEEYKDKTRIKALLEKIPSDLVQDVDMSVFKTFIEQEESSTFDILSITVEELKDIRRNLKKLMGLYLDADI